MECGSAGQCGAERACRGAKLCVQEGRDGRSNEPELRANGACTRQSDCETGWTCRTLRACVDDSGCNAGGALGVRDGVVAVGAGILIVLAAAARRRRTKR
jgi:hypothetical protein